MVLNNIDCLNFMVVVSYMYNNFVIQFGIRIVEILISGQFNIRCCFVINKVINFVGFVGGDRFIIYFWMSSVFIG